MSLTTIPNVGALYEVLRTEEPGIPKLGVVRAVGADYLMVQSVDEACRFDGFAVFLRTSIARVQEPANGEAIARVLAYRGGADDGHPQVDCDTLYDLLGSLADGRLVTLHDEDGSVCWVGTIEVGSEAVNIQLVRPNGEDGGQMRIPLHAISMVEWATAYDGAIGIMAGIFGPPPPCQGD